MTEVSINIQTDGASAPGELVALEAAEPIEAVTTGVSETVELVAIPPRAHTYEHVIRAATRFPWAIMPEVASDIAAILSDKVAGVSAPPDVLAAYAAATPRPISGSGGIAVLPLYGVISQKASMMTQYSGGTSTEQFGQAFRRAMADPNVSAIVIDVDSPGGSVFGVAELADEIRAARGQKPIVAVANSLMASAAYWIASQANEIVGTPSGQVGSVGVVAMHVDQTAANEREGMKPTIITAGKYKAEGSPHTPLSAEARDFMQEQVDSYYGMFTGAVAAGRGVSQKRVESAYGEGRVLGTQAAKQAGMIDRVETLDDTLARLATPTGRIAVLRRRSTSAEDLDDAPVALDEGEDIESLTPTKRAAERALRDVGFSASVAKAFVARGWQGDADRDDPAAAGEPAGESAQGETESGDDTGMVSVRSTEQARRRLAIAMGMAD
jgi:capsid assembly protease